MSDITKNKLPIHFPIYIISLLLVSLTSCVLSPIYMQVDNDVTYMYTFLPILLNYIILLFETMYLALIFAGVAFSVYAINNGAEKKIPNVVYPLCIIFLKHILNLLVSSIIDSYIDITFDIPVTVMLMCIDALIVALVWLVADKKSKQHLARAKKILKASKYLDTAEYNASIKIYPFGGFLNFRNPILLAILTGSVITTGSMILQRAYADIFVLGIPTSFFEIVEIFIAYLLDIALGVAGYATSYFAASYIFLREEK